jgi:hypothetical protein
MWFSVSAIAAISLGIDGVIDSVEFRVFLRS